MMQLNFTQITQQLMKPFYQAQTIVTQGYQWLGEQAVSWVHANSASLWIDAIEQDRAYQEYVMWQTALNKAMKPIRRHAFEKVDLSPQDLRQYCLTLQTTVISPWYYDKALAELATLPTTAFNLQTFQAIRTEFRQQLASNSDQPLIHYFYDDMVNGIIEQTREKSLGMENSNPMLPSILAYYAKLIPPPLLDEITLLLQPSLSPLQQITYLNQSFAKHLKFNTPSQEVKETLSWLRFHQMLKKTWRWVQTHPREILVTFAKGTALLTAGYGLHHVMTGNKVTPSYAINDLYFLNGKAVDLTQTLYTVSQVLISYELGRSVTGNPFTASLLSLSSVLPTSLAQTTSAGTFNTFLSTWGGRGEEQGAALQAVTDGYVVVGRTTSFGDSSSDLLLQKWDVNGNLLWTKTWGGSNFETSIAVQVVTDGYVVTGGTNSFGTGGSDLFLQKWGVNGTLLWTKTWGGNGDEQGNALQAATDGYVVTGYTESFGAGFKDLMLQKWDVNGNLLWTKTWGGSRIDFGSALQAVTDGYVVTGWTTSFGTGNTDLLLQKWDVNGNLLWTKTWDGSGWEVGTALQAVTDGYVVTGYTESFGTGGYDLLLQKWDVKGHLLWTKTWGGSNTELGNALQAVTDGYVVTGWTASFGAGNNDLLLQKWDVNGNLLWTKAWGGSNTELGTALQAVSDGYVVTGSTYSFGAGSHDLLLQKWDVNGNLLNCNGVVSTITNGTMLTPTGTTMTPVGNMTTPVVGSAIVNNGNLITPTTPAQSLCYLPSTQSVITHEPAADTTSSKLTPNSVIIGAAIGGGVLLLCLITGGGVFALYHRRHRAAPTTFIKLQDDINHPFIEIAKVSLPSASHTHQHHLIPFEQLSISTDKLGEGDFACVYRGTWQPIDTPAKAVAIKQFKAVLSHDEQAELAREMKAMRHLPNGYMVIQYGVTFMESTGYSLVIEYMAGGSLKQLLDSESDVNAEARYQIALDVAYGIQALHTHQIIHRDIKSSNILLSSTSPGQWHAKLGNVGLSKLLDENATPHTVTRSPGTLAWVAPERLIGDQYGQPVDIFSYGVVLWELATRETPKLGFTLPANDPDKKIPEACSKELKALMKDCWVQDPQKRPTADQVVERLNAKASTSQALLIKFPWNKASKRLTSMASISAEATLENNNTLSSVSVVNTLN